MGRGKHIDKDELELSCLNFLSKNNAVSGTEIRTALGVSVSTLSRITTSLVEQHKIVSTGNSRRFMKYVFLRSLPMVENPMPIYEVTMTGMPVLLGNLYAVGRYDFLFKMDSKTCKNDVDLKKFDGALFNGIPHFLNDILPSGYLARQLKSRYPQLELSDDPKLWSVDMALRYVANFGSDNSGNLLVGSKAFAVWSAAIMNTPKLMTRAKRLLDFPKLATNTLQHMGGSSAGGEQPKFLTHWTNQSQPHSVIVKFSPPTKTNVGKRVGELLICEHLALQVLARAGFQVAHTEIVQLTDRIYLEVSRFDRTHSGRKGIVSLHSLDAHHNETHSATWVQATQCLIDAGHVPKECISEIRQRFLFGQLIANTDMHFGNLSFYCEGLCHVTSLAPIYDMLPMLYHPSAGEITPKEFKLPLLTPDILPHLPKILLLAQEFWGIVAHDERIGREFRSIARQNHLNLAQLKHLI